MVTVILPVDGALPQARSKHSCSFIKNNNFLIVYGGESNDTISCKSNEGYKALNDIILFDINKKLWSTIVQYGFKPSGRWNTSLCVDDISERVYIFGGANHEEGFCSNALYILDLNSLNY